MSVYFERPMITDELCRYLRYGANDEQKNVTKTRPNVKNNVIYYTILIALPASV